VIGSSAHISRTRLVGVGALIALLVAVIGITLVRGTGSDSTESVPPPVVFLAPADAYAPDLVLFENGEARQLTDLDDETLDFAVSPDGQQIAFSRSNPDGTIDIWLLEIATGAMRPLTDCVKARCTAPAWHPGGAQVAYQRADTNPATGRTEPRAWVVDVISAESRLLSADLQHHGATPVWDPTGQRVAFFDETVPGIRILELATGSEVVIENPHGAVGSFSPDGSHLVYPVITRGALGETFYTHLEIVTLDEMTIERISGSADAPVEDVAAGWSPDGSRLLVARRYLDERYTSGTQLYGLDVASGQAEPLVVDPAYNHAAMAWDVAGRWIVFQRFSLVEAGAQPEIWLYDSARGESMRVAENAFLPAFVP
jgi:Tol biopolymer transport system component